MFFTNQAFPGMAILTPCSGRWKREREQRLTDRRRHHGCFPSVQTSRPCKHPLKRGPLGCCWIGAIRSEKRCLSPPKTINSVGWWFQLLMVPHTKRWIAAISLILLCGVPMSLIIFGGNTAWFFMNHITNHILALLFLCCNLFDTSISNN